MFEILILGALAAYLFNRKSNQATPSQPAQFTPTEPATGGQTFEPAQQPAPEVTTPATVAPPVTTIFEAATEADKPRTIYTPEPAPVITPQAPTQEEKLATYWDKDYFDVKPIATPEQTDFHPYLYLWTQNKIPYNRWGFADQLENENNIPEFRKQRVQAFLYWFLTVTEVVPFEKWHNLIHGDRMNLANSGELAKYCLENNTSLEAEIWKFEKAGGFGTVAPTENLPNEIGYGASQMQTDIVNRTGWIKFGIDYPREIKAKFAAFEVELAFRYGNLAAYINQFHKPIYQLYYELKYNLTPLYGRELAHMNHTLTYNTFSPKSKQALFLDELLKAFQTFDELQAWAGTTNIFYTQFLAYQAQQKKLGENEGHNAYFNAVLPARAKYVRRDTQADQLARSAETARLIAEAKAARDAELQAFTAGQKAQVTGTLLADEILEWLNKQLQFYITLPWPTTLSRAMYADPNERIKRFIAGYVIPRHGREDVYSAYLKTNGRQLWAELLEWEKTNPYQKTNMLSVDSETGLLSRESQNKRHFTLALPTQSSLKIGRIYIDEPGKVYIKDEAGAMLYTPEYYGNSLATKYELMNDAKGTYYTFKHLNP